MSQFIKSVNIRSLFDEKHINWELQKVNVLVGKNGLGKSTILRLIDSAVTHKHCDELDLCEKISIDFVNGKHCVARKNKEINQDILKELINKMSDSDEFSKAIANSFREHTKSEVIDSKDIEKIKYNLLESIKNKVSGGNAKKIDNGELSSYEIKSQVSKIKTEYISTVNMSANSVNNVTTSSGNHTTFLDVEIESEIKRLNANKETKKKLQQKLKKSLNSLFQETNKKVSFVDDQLEIRLLNKNKIDYKKLSSGERQVIFIFLKVINGSVDDSLILMDEPEISLHLSWQEKLLSEIVKVNSNSQIIIVTHSPAVVMNGWLDSFVDITNITTEL